MSLVITCKGGTVLKIGDTTATVVSINPPDRFTIRVNGKDMVLPYGHWIELFKGCKVCTAVSWSRSMKLKLLIKAPELLVYRVREGEENAVE